MKRPLDWPRDHRRTSRNRRSPSGETRNYVTLRDRLIKALHRFGAGHIAVSTDTPNGLYGTPVGKQRPLGDPGFVTYFQLNDWTYAISSDAHSDELGNFGIVADTADMIAQAPHYLRLEMLGPYAIQFPVFHQHITDQKQAGSKRRRREFPGIPSRYRGAQWWKDLGLTKPPASLTEAESAFRKQVHRHHPDRGGNTEKMQKAIDAVERARSNSVWPPL